MLKHEAAAYLAGLTSEDSSNTADPTNVHVISGEVSGTSEDGKVLVSIDGMMFSEDDDQYVEVDALGGLEDGDVATIMLTGESGHGMTPFALGTAGTVDRVKATAVNAANNAQAAQATANAAQAVAEATNQHFFTDDNGIHVTEETQEDWDANHTGANVLINSVGQLFRDGLNNLLTLTTENGARVLTVWDGLGNTSEHIRAIIGEIIQLGSVASGNYVKLDDSGLEVYNEEKTDGYSAKIGATFAEFLGGLLKLEYDVQGTSSDPIYVSDIRHTAPDEIGSLGFLEFKTLNAGKSNEKTVATFAGSEVNIQGNLKGSISTAFDVSTVQLMEGTVTIAAGGSTSTATAVGTHSVGWYPLGIVGWACNYGEITMARCRITRASDSDVGIEYVAHNTGTTARKPNLNVHVLWVRTDDI